MTDLQALIDNGMAWRLEGAIGRAAMDGLREGRYVLPETRHTDFYGTVVPSRHDVVPGTTGSLELHERFLSLEDER